MVLGQCVLCTAEAGAGLRCIGAGSRAAFVAVDRSMAGYEGAFAPRREIDAAPESVVGCKGIQ